MPDPTGPSELSFHYVKSPDYREISCDGALGGVTPKKRIWMALYAERGPVPRVMTFKAEATGKPNEFKVDDQVQPLRVETREGLVRHVEVTAYMDLEVAKALHRWLGQRIAQVEGEK